MWLLLEAIFAVPPIAFAAGVWVGMVFVLVIDRLCRP